MRKLTLPAVLLAALVAGEAQAQYYTQPGYGPRPEELVQQWYRQFLGREADPTAGYWVDKLKQGTPPEQALALILGSGEYYLRAGGNDPGFVRQVFNDLVGRPPSGGEYNYWLQQLQYRDRNAIAAEMIGRYGQSWRGGGYYEPPYDYRRPFDRYRYFPGG